MKKIYSFLLMAMAMVSAKAVDVTKFEKTLVTPPDGLVTETYTFKTCLSYAPGDTTVSQNPVAVGFDGNDVYVQGMSSDFPDAWVKGTISGDKAIFSSGQYVGEDFMVGYEFYFCAADEELEYEDGVFMNKNYSPLDSLVFDYDAATKTFTSKGIYSWYINDPWSENTGEFRYMSCYCCPELFPFEEKAGTPKDPEITYLMAFDAEFNYGFVAIKMDAETAEGDMLLKDNLYYNIYLDDELLTFDTDTYNISEDMTDVPYNFSSDEITSSDANKYITIYDTFQKIGVQVIYRDGDTEYRSNIISQTTGDDAVAGINTDAKVISTEYYSIDGQRLSSLKHGMGIKVEKLSNGQIRTSKAIAK